MKYEEIIECQFSTMKDKELHFHQEPEIIYLLDGELTDWLEQAYAFGQRPGRKQR